MPPPNYLVRGAIHGSRASFQRVRQDKAVRLWTFGDFCCDHFDFKEHVIEFYCGYDFLLGVIGKFYKFWNMLQYAILKKMEMVATMPNNKRFFCINMEQ